MEAARSVTTTASWSAAQAPKSPLMRMFEGLRAEIDHSKMRIDVVLAVVDESVFALAVPMNVRCEVANRQWPGVVPRPNQDNNLHPIRNN